MAARSGNEGPGIRERPPLCNWLEKLDREVRSLPKGAKWRKTRALQFQRCPLFIMVRYPGLMPRFPKQVIDPLTSAMQRQISEHPSAKNVLHRLNDAQKKQLAALLLDTIDALNHHNAHSRRATRVHKLAAEASRRIRSLNKKIVKARAALENLRDYASKLDPVLFVRNVTKLADTCLEKLSAPIATEGTPEFFKSIEAEYPPLEEPVQLAMVQLNWFFRSECALPGREAELRVALLRNAFWTKLGVSEVPFRPEYQVGESRGCNAVHTAVLRFRRVQPDK